LDDDDRPSGSIQPLSQADLQAILAHLGDGPDQLLVGTSADRPVVAVQVRASVGRPGGSAQAQWRLARAAEWAAWTRTLPWRVAATLGIGVSGGVLGRLLVPRLGLVVGVLAAMAAGWGLRFRPSGDAWAWQRGRRGSGGRPGYSARWSGRDGRSCMTWPSLVQQPTLIIWPSAAVGCSWSTPSGIGVACRSIHPGGCGMAATRSPRPCALWSSRPTEPPESWPTPKL
jgi:hypothetical protein